MKKEVSIKHEIKEEIKEEKPEKEIPKEEDVREHTLKFEEKASTLKENLLKDASINKPENIPTETEEGVKDVSSEEGVKDISPKSEEKFSPEEKPKDNGKEKVVAGSEEEKEADKICVKEKSRDTQEKEKCTSHLGNGTKESKSVELHEDGTDKPASKIGSGETLDNHCEERLKSKQENVETEPQNGDKSDCTSEKCSEELPNTNVAEENKNDNLNSEAESKTESNKLDESSINAKKVESDLEVDQNKVKGTECSVPVTDTDNKVTDEEQKANDKESAINENENDVHTSKTPPNDEKISEVPLVKESIPVKEIDDTNKDDKENATDRVTETIPKEDINKVDPETKDIVSNETDNKSKGKTDGPGDGEASLSKSTPEKDSPDVLEKPINEDENKKSDELEKHEEGTQEKGEKDVCDVEIEGKSKEEKLSGGDENECDNTKADQTEKLSDKNEKEEKEEPKDKSDEKDTHEDKCKDEETVSKDSGKTEVSVPEGSEQKEEDSEKKTEDEQSPAKDEKDKSPAKLRLEEDKTKDDDQPLNSLGNRKRGRSDAEVPVVEKEKGNYYYKSLGLELRINAPFSVWVPFS